MSRLIIAQERGGAREDQILDRAQWTRVHLVRTITSLQASLKVDAKCSICETPRWTTPPRECELPTIITCPEKSSLGWSLCRYTQILTIQMEKSPRPNRHASLRASERLDFLQRTSLTTTQGANARPQRATSPTDSPGARRGESRTWIVPWFQFPLRYLSMTNTYGGKVPPSLWTCSRRIHTHLSMARRQSRPETINYRTSARVYELELSRSCRKIFLRKSLSWLEKLYL